MKQLFAFTLLFMAATPSFAADANGYTAQYECRAGGLNCNVDVATYVAQTCDQTITTATTPTNDWSALDQSNNVICLDPGDYTARGKLTLSTSGTSGTRKVLRLSGSETTHPVALSSGNRATIAQIDLGANYWVLYRLAIDGTRDSYDALNINAVGNIIDKMLVENVFANGSNLITLQNDNNTIQNSVIRKAGPSGGTSDMHCINIGLSTNAYIVNNEIYDCQGDGIQSSPGAELTKGLIIENNDVYLTAAFYSDGSGNHTPSGNYACAENALDLKSGGSSSNPVRVIHNRVWGHRWTDGHCADGSGGEEIIFHSGAPPYDYDQSYGLIQNNIIFNGTYGVATPNGGNGSPHNWSVNGNIFYDLNHSPYVSVAYIQGHADYSEAYLNTFIANTKWIDFNGGTNDVMCNVAIDSSGYQGTPIGVDYSGYYGTSDSGETHKRGNYALNTRTNSHAYSLGDVIRTSTSPTMDCTATTDSACYLYKVTTAGMSAGSAPSYCTAPGCTTMDGTMVVTAIRGPYTYYRMLRTKPTLAVVPYARPYSGASEAYYCPSDFASRTGIGIDDRQL